MLTFREMGIQFSLQCTRNHLLFYFLNEERASRRYCYPSISLLKKPRFTKALPNLTARSSTRLGLDSRPPTSGSLAHSTSKAHVRKYD